VQKGRDKSIAQNLPKHTISGEKFHLGDLVPSQNFTLYPDFYQMLVGKSTPSPNSIPCPHNQAFWMPPMHPPEFQPIYITAHLALTVTLTLTLTHTYIHTYKFI